MPFRSKNGAKNLEPPLENLTDKCGHRPRKRKTVNDFKSDHTNLCLVWSNIGFLSGPGILLVANSWLYLIGTEKVKLLSDLKCSINKGKNIIKFKIGSKSIPENPGGPATTLDM